jgi:predicted nucleic acid-binding protein
MSDADSFLDTSVLLYLLSADATKADRVEQLLEKPAAISVQVLNEFTTVAIRKLGLSFAEVREVLDVVRAVCVTHPLTVEHHDKAAEIAERYRFSFYDSVIVASALLSDCKTLYSEDLQHQQVIEKQLTVINPFSKQRA